MPCTPSSSTRWAASGGGASAMPARSAAAARHGLPLLQGEPMRHADVGRERVKDGAVLRDGQVDGAVRLGLVEAVAAEVVLEMERGVATGLFFPAHAAGLDPKRAK